MKTNIIIRLLLLMIVYLNLAAQDAKEEIKNDISSFLSTKYGGIFKVNKVYDVNELLGDSRRFNEYLEDPYETLQDCYIFITDFDNNADEWNDDSFWEIHGELSNLVGVYKNGSVVWYGESKAENNPGNLYSTKDLNGDGSVEIIVQWGYKLSELEIFSWNGSTGRRISTLEPDRRIEGPYKGFIFFDVEGDGVHEIRNLEQRDGSLTWSWNGSEYGMWPSTPIVSDLTWFPRNNLSVNVVCTLVDDGSALGYNYTVHNKPESKQRINIFTVQCRTFNFTRNIPEGWDSSGHWVLDQEGWATKVFYWKKPKEIKPGETLTGFNFTSPSLPALAIYFVRGENLLPQTTETSFEEDSLDFLNNSVTGYTIGPKEPSDTLDNIDFLDSLISYDIAAYEFGWINDQKIFDKIDKYLVKAKEELEKSKIDKTRSALEKVLKEVEKENGKNLLSEAFALLKYNTEYLIGQLPPMGMTLDSIFPTMTITKTKTKDFKLTVYGSNFTKKCIVYWDKKKKKTKFISENELEAEIKEKDIKKEGIYIVTVREKKAGQTEEAEFNVYKELPERLVPVLNCIEDLEGKKSLAWFGYENYNDGTVFIDGKENEIKGGKKPKGKKEEEVPPVIFLPGVHEKVFSVEFDDKKKLKWELLKEKAEVTEETPVCE